MQPWLFLRRERGRAGLGVARTKNTNNREEIKGVLKCCLLLGDDAAHQNLASFRSLSWGCGRLRIRREALYGGRHIHMYSTSQHNILYLDDVLFCPVNESHISIVRRPVYAPPSCTTQRTTQTAHPGERFLPHGVEVCSTRVAPLVGSLDILAKQSRAPSTCAQPLG